MNVTLKPNRPLPYFSRNVTSAVGEGLLYAVRPFMVARAKHFKPHAVMSRKLWLGC